MQNEISNFFHAAKNAGSSILFQIKRVDFFKFMVCVMDFSGVFNNILNAFPDH